MFDHYLSHLVLQLLSGKHVKYWQEC